MWKLREIEDSAIVDSGDGRSVSLERLRTSRAELSELELSQRRMELTSVADVARTITANVSALRDSLLALPTVLASELAGLVEHEIAALLDREIRACLSELTAGFRRAASAQVESAV
jgi:hypothetical protein